MYQMQLPPCIKAQAQVREWPPPPAAAQQQQQQQQQTTASTVMASLLSATKTKLQTTSLQ
jgi:hypothetical protein